MIEYRPTVKQDLLFDYVLDNESTEILYGGAASGGKSYGICATILILALQKPNIRIGLARKNYTTLKRTTLVSLFEVANDWQINSEFTYNSQAGSIKFKNGSEIILIDLDYIPSEPNYERLQGLLLTLAFVDEAGELVEKQGWDVLFSRCGRWKNNELNIKQKIVGTCNPSANFLKDGFYYPYVQGTLPTHKKFIPALITDNPFMDESYRDNLIQTLDAVQIKRLIDGEWDYDSTDLDLFTVNDLMSAYMNKTIYNETDELFASVDVAVDRDDTIATIWKGLSLIDIVISGRDVNNIDFIKSIMDDFDIKPKNIIYDASGVGADIKRHLPFCVPFLGNATPLKGKNYRNLRNECYFKLSEQLSNGKVYIATEKEKERLKRELMVIKRREIIDNKVEIIDKKMMKRYLSGKSPDIADSLMMRMYFLLKTRPTGKLFDVARLSR